MQTVQVSTLPFHLHRKTVQVAPGLTLQDYVDHLFPGKLQRIVDVVVNIGDEVVPRHMWSRIKPKPMTLVGINAIPAGGKGKKNPLVMILSIALIVAAPYIVGAIAPAAAAAVTAGTATLGQTLTVGLIRLGIGMVGFLATSMLSSVPKQRALESSASEASSNFIEGASNEINRYGIVPANLGTNRVFPPQAALPYTETSGNKQYVRQIFTYGFGDVVVDQRQIGETALTEYDGVEINTRLNSDLNLGTALYSNDVFQEGFSITVSNAASYIVRTTQTAIDEAELDLTFANGLTSYNDAAQRIATAVDVEVTFSPTGLNQWSNAFTPTSHTSQTVVVPNPTTLYPSTQKYTGYYILVLDIYTGAVTALYYTVSDRGGIYGTGVPPIPEGKIRIGSFRAERGKTGAATIIGLIDERGPYIGGKIYTSGSFLPSYPGTGLTVNIAAGQSGPSYWHIVDATAQAVRVTKRLVFPTNGQYDIRVRRLTGDAGSDRVRDVITLSAIRSIKHTQPINQANISGEAMRMQATDQLNGTVNQYNAVVSTLITDWDADDEVWRDRVISSNPASVYRHVLQNPGFVKNLPDERIGLEKLQEWHEFCTSKGLTYNRFIKEAVSIDDLLNDIAAAGMATPHKINGVYSVIIDNERTEFKGMVTPRNSWGYNGQITYPDLPHALRVEFRNKEKGYSTDERIVYNDGYDESNAELFERLQFDSCTDAALAWFYGRQYFANAILQPEVHTWNQDFENLTFNRGDKIVFVNDAILVGVGQGRIDSLLYTPSLTHVIGFYLDELVTIPTVGNFGVRIRHGDGEGFIYYALNTTVGETNHFIFTTPVLVADAPPLDSLCTFTEFGDELELIITEVSMNKDHSARVLAVNYAPERFNAASGTIPPFNSHVVIPLDFYRPLPPVQFGNIQSDETVMSRNSDGSYIGRMVIPLKNPNEPSVAVIVRVRPVGATQWSVPNVLSATPDQVVLTGLEDGNAYDISIAYQRPTGLQLVSIPLLLNGTVYAGASARPSDVEDFMFNTIDGTGLFEWKNNPEIDISHYTIKFTRLITGVEWFSSQILADNITNNRFVSPIQAGTYLIKAVDILGNESANATTIVSIDNGAFNNVVELIQMQPAWTGIKTNTHAYDGALYLTDPTLYGQYDLFPYFDLGDVYECVLSSSLVAEGAFYNRIRAVDSIRDLTSIRGEGSNDIRSISSIRALQSVRGIDPSDWFVDIYIGKSLDGVTYTSLEPLIVGKHTFRYLQVVLIMISNNPMVSPKVTTAEVLVDMPDRYEKFEDVACPPTGAIITYEAAFRANPAVNITLQNGATDDRLEYVYKDETGMHVKVWNQTTAGYVTRTMDVHAAGYGRLVT